MSQSDRVRVIAALVEGNSLRSITRMTGVVINSVMRLLGQMGDVCAEYQDEHLRNLNLKHIECDEIWSFCYAKAKNVPHELRGEKGIGDVWTWVAIDAETKLIPCWLVGDRDAASARTFVDDLAGRVLGTPQITTDGLKLYVRPIADSFGELVDYAQLIKIYGAPEPGTEARYSPSRIIGAEALRVSGEPDLCHVSTSYVERQNLTMRMGMRRFTRLTNGFSKKIENHIAAVALHYMHYNYCRIHKSLRVTPAMAAGISDHVWSLEEVVGLLEAKERRMIESGKMKRGAYGPRKNSK